MPANLCTFLILTHLSKHLIDLNTLGFNQSYLCFLVSFFHIFEHQDFILFTELVPGVLELLNLLKTVFTVFFAIIEVFDLFRKFGLDFLYDLGFFLLNHLYNMLVYALDFVDIILALILQQFLMISNFVQTCFDQVLKNF